MLSLRLTDTELPPPSNVAGEFTTNLKYFRCDRMKGTTNGSGVDVAKDVVQYLNLKDDEEISFSIRYIFDGVHHVYGYIYKVSQHHYGTIHVDMIGRISVTITVTADVYRTV